MLDGYEPREMMEALDQTPAPKTFFLDTFFKKKEFHTTRKVDIDIVKGKRKMAPFVHPDLPATASGREGYRTDTFEPPYIKPMRPITPAMLLERQPGETIYKGGLTPDQRFDMLLGKDLAEMRMEIVRREEWMARCALLDAKIHVVGEGVDAVIDFMRDPSHVFVLTDGDRWSQATSDPFKNLRAWKLKIMQDSGLTPTVAVVGAAVADAMLRNPVVLDLLDNRRVEMGQINPRELAKGVTYLGSLDSVDFYAYAEWFVDDDGTEKPMVPDNKMILGSDAAKCVRHFGVIQDLNHLKQPVEAAVDYFPYIFGSDNPSRLHILLQSAPLPVPHEVDAFATITPI